MGIDRKVAVITGASQGIGAALVNGYLDRNYRVIATSRSVKPSSNPDSLVIPGDIADRKTAEQAIAEGVSRFGRIDTLVNNAGIFIAKPFTEYTKADFTAVLRTNTAGFFPSPSLLSPKCRSRAVAISCRSQPASSTSRGSPLPRDGRLCDRRDPPRRRWPERRSLNSN